MPRLSRALALVVATLPASSSCQIVRDYSTYRELVAHEREFADVAIERFQIDVALEPEHGTARVLARATLHNGGSAPLERVRLLLSEHASLRSARDDRGDLEHTTEVVRLRSFVARMVEVRFRDPLAPQSTREIALDYDLSIEGTSEEAKLGPNDGYLLIESLWSPMLHTPLSNEGFDRAGVELSVTLPEALVPVGLPELTRASSDGITATYVGASDFRFSPFLAYGRFSRSEAPGAEVFLLDEPGDAPARFILDAALEVRDKYEAWLGTPGLERAKIVAVKRLDSSWGAPYCLLLDDGLVPRATAQEFGCFETLSHELAHTWFGDLIAPRGKLGYLHEGFAQHLCARAVEERYGAAKMEREYEVWELRYARDPAPLGRGLASLSLLDRESYVRGSYLVAPHFLRALEERLGRERWQQTLRDFAESYAGRGADLDDLRAVVRRHAGRSADDVLRDWLDSPKGGDELHARGRALVLERMAYWRAREPRPKEVLRTEVRAKLDEALALLSSADLANLPAKERASRAGALLKTLRYENDVQTTVIDRAGNAVFHVMDNLRGSVLGHQDVGGASVYQRVLDANARRGESAYFDFPSSDLKSARETALAYARVENLPWTVVVEGHDWRSME